MYKFLKNNMDYNKLCVKRIKIASKLYQEGGIYKIISIIMHRRNRRLFNVEIYPQVDVENIIIPHAVGIVIGITAKIGEGTVIMPNVVIGARFSPNKKNPKERRHACIGKNCIIGANSVIIGNINIGDNVTIGAGSIITKDIPNNSTVIGNNNILNTNVNEDVKYYEHIRIY